jgi:hypothetical protein
LQVLSEHISIPNYISVLESVAVPDAAEVDDVDGDANTYSGPGSNQEIRTYFPETWLWNLETSG